jgi:hypothetical protein
MIFPGTGRIFPLGSYRSPDRLGLGRRAGGARCRRAVAAGAIATPVPEGKNPEQPRTKSVFGFLGRNWGESSCPRQPLVSLAGARRDLSTVFSFNRPRLIHNYTVRKNNFIGFIFPSFNWSVLRRGPKERSSSKWKMLQLFSAAFFKKQMAKKKVAKKAKKVAKKGKK